MKNALKIVAVCIVSGVLLFLAFSEDVDRNALPPQSSDQYIDVASGGP